jgi:hypothetical protein
MVWDLAQAVAGVLNPQMPALSGLRHVVVGTHLVPAIPFHFINVRSECTMLAVPCQGHLSLLEISLMRNKISSA